MSKSVNSTSGTIKYRLKDTNSIKETSILLDYSFGRNNRIKFSTGYKVAPKHWDKSNQRIRAVSTIKNREKVNSDLKLYAFEFTKAISELNDFNKVDREILKSLLQRIIRGEGFAKKEIKSFIFKFKNQ